MTGWRSAIRIAWREGKRAKGRSAMVLAMIAVPVMFLTFLATGFATFTLTPAEEADRLMGTGQAVVSWPKGGPVAQIPEMLIAFPISGQTASPSAAPTEQPTEQPAEAKLLALLPQGSSVLRDETGALGVKTVSGTADIATRLLDYADPRAQGILRPLGGRAPRGADEAALTPAASRRTGVGIGGTLQATDGRQFRVVGTVEDPGNLSATTIVMLPDPAKPATPATKWLVSTSDPITWAQIKELNKSGITARSRHVMAHPPAQSELYDLGIHIGGGLGGAELVLIAGVAVLEIVLLAGPAFAVGARRRRRDLALVAAAGGTPAHVRRIVLADGVVLGAVAAALGIVLGVVAFFAGHGWLEQLSNARIGSLRVPLGQLAGLAALALITGVLAALVPAWISSRQDVVTALAGRRGITRSRRRWVVAGLGLVAVGAALSAFGAVQIEARLIVGGLILAELGLVLCTPAFVGLVARLGRLLPVSPRIALRDASRNRTAAAPAIAAVMAAVAGSLAIGVVLSAENARERTAYNAHGPLGSVIVTEEKGLPGSADMSNVDSIEGVLREHLSVGAIHVIKIGGCEGGCFITPVRPPANACPYVGLGHEPTRAEQAAARKDPKCKGVEDGFHVESMIGMPVLVVEERDVAAVTMADPSEVERIQAALRSGAVVVDDSRYLDNGTVTFEIKRGLDPKASGQRLTAQGYARTPRTGTARTLMTAETAQKLGLQVTTVAVLATTTQMPTTAQEDELRAALSGFGDGVALDVERGPAPLGTQLIILAVVSGLITLVAAALATGLAATDGRADLATLGAVGASPRMRRTLTLSQSGVIAGLGSLLGTVAGVGAALAVLFALNRVYAGVWPEPVPYPISVPWLNIGVALLVVPLVAMLGTGLFTRSRLPIERRQ